MILIVNLLQFLDMVLSLYMWVVIGSAIISWVNPDPYNPIVRFLHAVTDPVLNRIRRVIPTTFGAVDIAPVILIFAIIFVQRVVIGTVIGSLLTHQAPLP
ncbi:MAG: YggT family protein [Deltaproteobacteria bacterium]|nr:YggT family protein [Deltaproteobacteria bacterium]